MTSRVVIGALVVVAMAAAAGPVGARDARLAVEPRLHEAAAPMAVEGANPRRWGADLAFGEFRAVDVRDGDRLEWFFALGNFGAGGVKSASRLTLEGAVGSVRVVCLAERRVLARGSFSVDLAFGRKPILLCGLESSDGDRWAFALTERAPNLEGSIEPVDEAGGDPLKVRSIHRLEGSRWPLAEPAGYEISLGGRVVAAVEIVNRGRVWIDPTLEVATRNRIAAAAAALLLFEPPEVESEP
ncbi:MAG TPA: hypothetical protein VLB51_14015 [Methylomirabilota bacterium]|nr:hypothetical protein [Methylomirabilota bacterium]